MPTVDSSSDASQHHAALHQAHHVSLPLLKCHRQLTIHQTSHRRWSSRAAVKERNRQRTSRACVLVEPAITPATVLETLRVSPSPVATGLPPSASLGSGSLAVGWSSPAARRRKKPTVQPEALRLHFVALHDYHHCHHHHLLLHRGLHPRAQPVLPLCLVEVERPR